MVVKITGVKFHSPVSGTLGTGTTSELVHNEIFIYSSNIPSDFKTCKYKDLLCSREPSQQAR